MCSLAENPKFPSTRFLGSKVKIIDWLWGHVSDRRFSTVLDAFGGTGCFSFTSKKYGKRTYFNDALSFNHVIGTAIIQNSITTVSEKETAKVMVAHKSVEYKKFIEQTFAGIYFTDEENKWLDLVVQNISLVENKYKQAILFSALGQSCLIKRPYNLFHRKNLYMRMKKVERTFNNKKCWDTPFQQYFFRFVKEYNEAVFCNGNQNLSTCSDVFSLNDNFDLVYLDPPYMSGKISDDYLSLYHFLDGITDYNSWHERIDYSTKNRKLKSNNQVKQWGRKSTIDSLLDKLIEKFSASIIVMSYRNDGYPTSERIIELFKKHKGKAPDIYSLPYQYALSKKPVSELLFIAE